MKLLRTIQFFNKDTILSIHHQALEKFSHKKEAETVIF